jgi:hypothetical protein
MKRVTKGRGCLYCGCPVSPTKGGGGRPRLYCKPSHRVRALEKRQAFEAEHRTDKLLRLLRPALISLANWRGVRHKSPGLDELRRAYGLPHNLRYQRAVDRAREIITELAPEVIQDLQDNIRRKLSGIEADRIIERQERLGSIGIDGRIP